MGVPEAPYSGITTGVPVTGPVLLLDAAELDDATELEEAAELEDGFEDEDDATELEEGLEEEDEPMMELELPMVEDELGESTEEELGVSVELLLPPPWEEELPVELLLAVPELLTAEGTLPSHAPGLALQKASRESRRVGLKIISVNAASAWITSIAALEDVSVTSTTDPLPQATSTAVAAAVKEAKTRAFLVFMLEPLNTGDGLLYLLLPRNLSFLRGSVNRQGATGQHAASQIT